ncbi:L-amino acid N-acyltransferase YncA [Thermosporothrix hazakensis]|jgi:GNAT superfamily N-acetyltransferase|uniref:L-amino acid N-acyltransferase YncA n=2 Tax=Thermosporothrix TaxID=768650 RepID=A0A326U7J7_THEHA|nr:GNAT family N-acetyltransferase [Thermosporothrix hazakensis]PZW26713.1 L-amino acid N-acyltransferase YncA [Thermosporothrix hazakensis]BBH89405.1 hypothetical protein KTC_41560 [Thermosporothrix sp. COM3]GCE47588.1 hypothetical protein KTH_24570 [Thermosporothrix hazakensis]
MPQIETRPARPEDRDIVLAFCAHTWEDGDYIEEVWDEWLNNPAGQLVVVTVDDRPAGILHMEMLTPTDAWLEGLRVDPTYRRQGLARRMNEAALLEAMRRGAQYIRMAISHENQRSLELAEAGGFRKVAGFLPFSTVPALDKLQKISAKDRPRPATIEDLDDIISFLNASNVFPIMAGLYFHRFRAIPITAVFLEEKIKEQQIYLTRRWEKLDGLAIFDVCPPNNYYGTHISLGYIDGTSIEPVSLLAYELLHHAITQEMDRVRVYLPDQVFMRDAFSGVGYTGASFEENDNLFFVYEKGLF